MSSGAVRTTRGATRDDVARLAGVSSAVVSYVVNEGPRPVAPATRARVLDAIAKLGQVSKVFKAEDVTTNQFIAAANDFDHAKVKADADAFQLSDDYKAVDVAAIQAAL